MGRECSKEFGVDADEKHREFIKVFTPNDAQIFEKGLIKFTLKQLRHVSVQSPSSGSALFELAKVTFVKTVN